MQFNTLPMSPVLLLVSVVLLELASLTCWEKLARHGRTRASMLLAVRWQGRRQMAFSREAGSTARRYIRCLPSWIQDLEGCLKIRYW